MKKLIFLLIVLAVTFTANVSAQIRVNYAGKVMKRIWFILLVLCLTMTVCKDEKPEIPTNLTSIRWKLTGIVDAEIDVLTELEPKDCKECYTLTFDTNTTAIARSINHKTFTLDLINLTPDVIWNICCV